MGLWRLRAGAPKKTFCYPALPFERACDGGSSELDFWTKMDIGVLTEAGNCIAFCLSRPSALRTSLRLVK